MRLLLDTHSALWMFAGSPSISVALQHGIARLPITLEAIFDLGRLPAIHRDPFDRMLIAQAVRHGCALVTCDPEIQKYSVTVHWR